MHLNLKAKRQTSRAPASLEATREQLLAAASVVFAETGFRDATVREICERAGANIAAVNYHFGDKETLYSEVLKTAYARAHEKYPADFGLPSNAPGEQRLFAFVRAFLLRIFDEGPHSHHGKLMAREMVDPTAALDAIVREGIGQQAATISKIVRELFDGKASEELVRRCGMSVVSQVLFYHHCRPVISRLFPDLRFEAKQIDQLAEHITRFSLAGIRAMKNEAKPRKK